MSLFNRFKTWLRSIIVQEVVKISSSLTKERAEAIAALKNVENEMLRSFDAEFAALKSRIRAAVEAEHEAFVVRLRATREHVSNGEPNVCRSTPEQIASDHALKMVK